MFAFALWDARREQLLLARDRVGKKPLFYAQRDGVADASPRSCGALLQDDEIPREVDHVALDRYLAYGYVPAPLTRAPRRAQAPAGAHARAADGRADARALLAARLRRRSSTRRVEELCERIRAALLEATRAPDDRRRPARRLPVGRHRLVGGRRGDGAGLARAGADVLDRLRRRALRRAAARAPRSPSASAPITRSSAVERRRGRRSCRGSSATTASRSPTPRRSRASTSPS